MWCDVSDLWPVPEIYIFISQTRRISVRGIDLWFRHNRFVSIIYDGECMNICRCDVWVRWNSNICVWSIFRSRRRNIWVDEIGFGKVVDRNSSFINRTIVKNKILIWLSIGRPSVGWHIYNIRLGYSVMFVQLKNKYFPIFVYIIWVFNKEIYYIFNVKLKSYDNTFYGNLKFNYGLKIIFIYSLPKH